YQSGSRSGQSCHGGVLDRVAAHRGAAARIRKEFSSLVCDQPPDPRRCPNYRPSTRLSQSKHLSASQAVSLEGGRLDRPRVVKEPLSAATEVSTADREFTVARVLCTPQFAAILVNLLRLSRGALGTA